MREGRKKPGAGLPPLSPEDARALEDQVSRLREALQTGPDLETWKGILIPRPRDLNWDLHLLAALAALPHPAVPEVLAALFGGARDRERLKALKRALHLLRTRGVAVPPELLPREEVPPPRLGGELSARVSPVFGPGERFVILEGSREILGGNILVARVSDQEGFKECYLLNLKRGQLEEFWQGFRDQGLVDWAPAPPAYAAGLLEEAYALNPKAEAAGQYVTLRERLARYLGAGKAPSPEELLPPLEPGEKSRGLEQSRELARHPLFHYWLPPMAELRPWLERLKEAEDSPLVLTEQQTYLRLQGVVEEAVRALYPPESRPRWARRLLAMAVFLRLRGDGDAARAAQAAAEDLAAGNRGALAGENPFLLALVQGALRLAQEMEKRETPAPSGLVVPPTPQSLMTRR